MHTILVKDCVAVYCDCILENLGTHAADGSLDPTTRTDNTTAIEIESLPNYFRCGCYTWDGAALTATDAYNAEKLPTAKADKLAQIDEDTSAAILAGFDYAVDGTDYHFSYDAFDQQNFADTANVCLLKIQGVEGLPDSVAWNSYSLVDGSLVRQTFTAQQFLALYTGGAMAHKNTAMQTGGARKSTVEAATTLEEVAAA